MPVTKETIRAIFADVEKLDSAALRKQLIDAKVEMAQIESHLDWAGIQTRIEDEFGSGYATKGEDRVLIACGKIKRLREIFPIGQ